MSDNSGIMILAEAPNGKITGLTTELLGAGRRIADIAGEKVSALAVGAGLSGVEAELIAFGADTVYMVDARIDLADFAEDPNALAPGKLVGLGGALGRHPRLGKNTLFVVMIIANPLKAAPKVKAPAKK